MTRLTISVTYPRTKKIPMTMIGPNANKVPMSSFLTQRSSLKM